MTSIVAVTMRWQVGIFCGSSFSDISLRADRWKGLQTLALAEFCELTPRPDCETNIVQCSWLLRLTRSWCTISQRCSDQRGPVPVNTATTGRIRPFRLLVSIFWSMVMLCDHAMLSRANEAAVVWRKKCLCDGEKICAMVEWESRWENAA